MAREKKSYQVLTFQTTTQAMAFEKYCQQEGLPGRMIPVPREITAGCGLAWRIPSKDYEEAREQIEARAEAYEAITEVLM